MKTRRAWFAVPVLAAVATAAALSACSSTHPRRDPTGEVFPSVRGTSLDGEETALPQSLAGSPALLVVGYRQSSQFDIDRWLLGLDQSGLRIRTLELPTIPGWLPGLFSGSIDGGMRRGIPREDWSAVVTLYDDADDVARFTGNDEGLPARVLLLDAEGRVTFFHDRGYSVGSLQALAEAMETLGARPN